MAIGDTLLILLPADNEPPASNPATDDTRNYHPVLDFDDTADESAVFSAVMPNNYSGISITLRIHYAMTSATSGTVNWKAQFERIGDQQQDIDSDGFGVVRGEAYTVPSTSGLVDIAEMDLSSYVLDGVLAGEGFRLKLMRYGSMDTAAGDAELLRVDLVDAMLFPAGLRRGHYILFDDVQFVSARLLTLLLDDEALAATTWALLTGKALADSAQTGDAAPTFDVSKVLADEADISGVLSSLLDKVLADGIDASEAQVMTVGKVLADGWAVGDVLALLVGKTLADSAQTGDVTPTFDVDKMLADGADAGDVLSTLVSFFRTVEDGAVAVDAAPIFDVDKVLEDDTVASEARAMAVSKALTGGWTVGDALALLAGKALADEAQAGDSAPTFSAGKVLADEAQAGDAISLVMAFVRLFSAGVLAEDALAKAISLAPFEDGVTAADVLTSILGRLLVDGVTAGDTGPAFVVAKVLANIVLADEVLATSAGFIQSLSDGVTVGDDLALAVGKVLADSALAGDTISAFAVEMALADEAQAGEVLSPSAAFVRSFSDGMLAGETLAKAISLAPFEDGVTAGDVLAMAVGKALGDAALAGDAISTFAAQLALADSAVAGEVIAAFDVGKVLTAAVIVSETLRTNEVVIVLTLSDRSFGLAVPLRVFRLTLDERDLDLKLPKV